MLCIKTQSGRNTWDGTKVRTVRYDEDVYVGYRHFDTDSIRPLYPFGYGKSYTTFEYSDRKVEEVGDSIVAIVKVTNTGNVAGKEIVELYVSAPQVSMKKPLKELKALAKTPLLKPGQSAVLRMSFPTSLLASYSAFGNKWIIDKGNYSVLFAASAEDIRLVNSLEMQACKSFDVESNAGVSACKDLDERNCTNGD